MMAQLKLLRLLGTVSLVFFSIGGCANSASTSRVEEIGSTATVDHAFVEAPTSGESAANSSAVSTGAPPPPAAAEAAELYHFDNLDQLVATSDTVVIARVANTAPGPRLGDSVGFQLQLQEAELDITEVLFGPVPTGSSLYELGWDGDGRAIEANSVSAVASGDEGIFFLSSAEGPSVAPGSHVLINSQGRYLFGEGDSLQAANERDELSRDLAARGRQQLTADIRTAADRARSGAVRPVEPRLESGN